MRNVTWNKNRGTYEARIGIPFELRKIIGRGEFRENLGADKRQAERKALGVLNNWHQQLEEAREKLAATGPTISKAVKAHYRQELQADDYERVARDHTEAAFKAASRSVYAAKLRLIAAGEITGNEAESLVGYAANSLIEQGLAPNIPRHDLLKALAAIQIETLIAAESRDAGAVTLPEAQNPLLTVKEDEPAKTSQDHGKGKTLAEVLVDFHKERGTSLNERTIDEHKRVVTYFQQVIGADISARSITKRHVLDFKRALLETPAAFDSKPDLRGLTLPQAVKANEKRKNPYPVMSVITINNKYLAHIKTILKWASDNDYIDMNPATGIRVNDGKKAHKEPTRIPFDQADLKAIFGHPMFADPSKYETKQWALLLALYTGARSSSELARLTINNVCEEEGVTVLNLAHASKNIRSRRLVPVHDDLVKLGFIKYVATLREKKETYVFPEWAKQAKTINDWFTRTFLPSIGIVDSRKVFHSFRHSFKTALARHGVSRDVQDAITGHADHTAAAGYIHAEPIKAMAAGLNSVSFQLPIVN